MDQKLIIKALNSACGNKNFKFQVVIRHDQLHIYANHRADYPPNYKLLEVNVGNAISSLALEDLDSVWLYGRPLDRVEPNWKIFVELPTQAHEDSGDTVGNTEALESEIDFAEFKLFEEFPTDNSTGDTGLLHATGMVHKNLFRESEVDAIAATIGMEEGFEAEESDLDLPEFEDFPEDDSTGDTGLLQDTGLIHGTPLKEEEIDFSVVRINVGNTLDDSPQSEIKAASDLDIVEKPLDCYCFVTNKKLLTSDIIPPGKEIVRLVKFFHHLTDKNQYKLLPLLERYFQHTETPDLEKMAIAIQRWFKQISELEYDEQKIVAIWLSRYCYAPDATLAEFKTIAAQNAVTETAKKNLRRNSHYSFTPASSPATNQEQLEELVESQFKIPLIVKRLILPSAWILTTVLLILWSIWSNGNSQVITSGQIPSLCQNTIGSPNYCRLAVNLAGAKTISQSPRSLFPLTEVTETVATYGCERYANLKAGVDNDNLAPEQTPVISSYGEKIFPHIYVVEAEQKNVQQQINNIKVGCVYTTGQGQRSPELLAADIIPLTWPTEHYQPQASLERNLTFGILTQPISLGLYTIFAALGIAISSWFNLGIKINHPQTVYLAAITLGFAQVIASAVAFLGIVTSFMLPAVTIMIISLLVKDFQIRWSRGYLLVAVGIFSIITIQFLFYNLCLGLINIWI